jgi:hypothetical protein
MELLLMDMRLDNILIYVGQVHPSIRCDKYIIMRFSDLLRRQPKPVQTVQTVRSFSGGGTMKGNKFHFAAPTREVAGMMDRYFTKVSDDSWESDDGWKMTLIPNQSIIVFREP